MMQQTFGSSKTDINISINAAGVVTEESFLETTDKNLTSTFNVNVSSNSYAPLSPGLPRMTDIVDTVYRIFSCRTGLRQGYGSEMGETGQAQAK